MWIFCSDKRGNSKRERWNMRNRGEGEKDASQQNGQEIDQCTEAMNREEGVLELLESRDNIKTWLSTTSYGHKAPQLESRLSRYQRQILLNAGIPEMRQQN